MRETSLENALLICSHKRSRACHPRVLRRMTVLSQLLQCFAILVGLGAMGAAALVAHPMAAAISDARIAAA